MRHVSRTHRVALDGFFDRINLDSKIQIKYIDTRNQLKHIDQRNLTRDELNHLLCLFHICHFSSKDCSEEMSKRTKNFWWRKSHSKIEADDQFGLAMHRTDSWCATFYCIRKPRENQTWKSFSSELEERAASKNRETCFGRLLINLHSGMLTRSGFLKSGNLMKCWK